MLLVPAEQSIQLATCAGKKCNIGQQKMKLDLAEVVSCKRRKHKDARAMGLEMPCNKSAGDTGLEIQCNKSGCLSCHFNWLKLQLQQLYILQLKPPEVATSDGTVAPSAFISAT
jgi:hypothetical protein